MAFTAHEAYFASVSLDVRRLLEAIQAKVEVSVTGVSRCIGYNLPAFMQARVCFHFAAFKKHVGIYPPVTQDAQLFQELSPYRGEKANLSFPSVSHFPST